MIWALNLPWLFKLPSEMAPDEFRQCLIAKMQVDMARLRWRHLVWWWAL